MMEPKLTDADEAILVRLQTIVEKRLLTPEQAEFLRKGMVLQESMGIFGRFIIGLAGFVAATLALISYWPFGASK